MNLAEKRIVSALSVMTMSAVGMFLVRVATFHSNEYWYLNWNLLLAWLPLVFAWLLVVLIKHKPWVSWRGISLTLLWLGFLPNSFYIATDLIHLQNSNNDVLLFDVVLLLLFTLSGFVLGFLSVFLVHDQLIKRVGRVAGHLMVASLFVVCSFAIYLGRFLRWNTWDVITNPAGLLVDVSDRIINPVAHRQTFWVTVLIFTLLATTYYVIWQFAEITREEPRR